MDDLYAYLELEILSASTYISRLKEDNIVEKEKQTQEEVIKTY